jgi:tetratricopeptide (TPR) repeat protein
MSYIRKRKSKKAGTVVQEIIADERNLSSWISENVNTLIYVGGAVLFVLFISLGVVWVKSQRAQAASEDLAGALRFYWNTIALQPSGEPETDKVGLEQALQNFIAVSEEHDGRLQGQTAAVYRSRVLYKLGRYGEAAAILEQLETENTGLLTDINAHYLLAKSFEASGEYEKAIGVYSRMRDGSVEEMRAVLAIDIARCSEIIGDVEQAISLYREILTEYPESVFAVKSEKKLVTLGVFNREEI